MRNRHIVAYDVSDPARLRRVHRKMNGFGDPLQYSVFACDLSAKERVLQEWRGTATRYAGNAASSLAICRIHALTAPSVYRRLEALCRRRRICRLAARP